MKLQGRAQNIIAKKGSGNMTRKEIKAEIKKIEKEMQTADYLRKIHLQNALEYFRDRLIYG